MAEIITEMPQSFAKRSKYPWDEWLDGKSRKLIGGVDFQLSAWQFRHSCFQACAARGLRISCRLDIRNDTVYLQAVGHDDEPAASITARRAEINGYPVYDARRPSPAAMAAKIARERGKKKK